MIMYYQLQELEAMQLCREDILLFAPISYNHQYLDLYTSTKEGHCGLDIGTSSFTQEQQLNNSMMEYRCIIFSNLYWI
jgi:hypothetical protein